MPSFPVPAQPETPDLPTELDVLRARRQIEKALQLQIDTRGLPALLIRAALHDWRIGEYLAAQTLKNRDQINLILVHVARFLTTAQGLEELENFVARQRFSQLVE